MKLVFGAGGQVGKHLSQLDGVAGFAHSQVDITDASQVASVVKNVQPKSIINAAAFTNVELAESHEYTAREVNTLGAGNLAEICNRFSIPLIHLSTDYVFDGCHSSPYCETDLPNPINKYGQTKFMGERKIQQICQNYAIIRTSWIFSEHGKNFVKSIYDKLKTEPTISVISDQTGGPTSALSIANACNIVATNLVRDNSYSGIYHFTGFPNVSWYEFACSIKDLTGFRGDVVPINSEKFRSLAKRPRNSCLDCNKISKTFGIERPSWIEHLEQTLTVLNRN